jgi:hypothetical protein
MTTTNTTTITVTMTSVEAGAIYSALRAMYGEDHAGTSDWPEMVAFGRDLLDRVELASNAEAAS